MTTKARKQKDPACDAEMKSRPFRRARMCGDVTFWLFCGGIVCGLVLTIYTLLTAAAVSFDAARYLELAAEFYHEGPGGALDWYAGPAVPVVVGTLYGLTGELELTGRLIGIAAASGIVLVTWLLLARTVGRDAAHLGAALLATHPAIIRHAPSAEIDLPYLAVLSLALYWLFLACEQNRRLWPALAAGIAFGTAYLIRPEGLLVALAACGYAWIRRRGGFPLHRTAPLLTVIVAVLMAAPYLVWLHETLGRWTLSGKDRTLSLKYLPDKKNPERALRAGPLGAIAQNPDDLIKWLPTHVKRTCTELPKAAGYVTAALALLGALALWRRRMSIRQPASGLLAVACLPPAAAFALLYPYERYFLQALPLVAVLAAVGAARLWQFRAGRKLVIIALAINLLVAAIQAREPLEASRAYRRAIGERIAAEFGPGRRVLAFTVEAFYARAQRVKRWDPFEGIVPGHGFGEPFSYDRLLAFLKANQVEVVVVDEHFRKDCPEFESRRRPDDFRLVFTTEHKGQRIAVYEVLAVTRSDR